MGAPGRLEVVADAAALAREAAADFARRAAAAVAARGRFAVALSGGSTPRRLYALLADPSEPFRDGIEWPKTHLFWGDERHVPPDDPDSNFRMARQALISKVPIPEENVHRVRAELPDASEAAFGYQAEIERVFGLTAGEVPAFDLILLGIGTEGHTASLFPGTAALEVQDRLVAANWVPKLSAFRITMTIPVFDRARAVVFLISGEDKAGILARILGPPAADPFPAQRIRPRDGELVWLVDRAAASRLGPFGR